MCSLAAERDQLGLRGGRVVCHLIPSHLSIYPSIPMYVHTVLYCWSGPTYVLAVLCSSGTLDCLCLLLRLLLLPPTQTQTQTYTYVVDLGFRVLVLVLVLPCCWLFHPLRHA